MRSALLGCVAALSCAAIGRAAELKGKELYDALYKSGWGKDTRVSQGSTMLATVRQLRREHRRAALATVLDVGCSHGDVVDALWHMGVVASGVDIAEGAVELAAKLHVHRDGTAGCNAQRLPCFQQASATSLPFADQSFDAITSSDVLEHVDPSEVRAATAEFARVAKSFLVLKIANRNEGSTLANSHSVVGEHRGLTFEQALHKQGLGGRLPKQLCAPRKVTRGAHIPVRGAQCYKCSESAPLSDTAAALLLCACACSCACCRHATVRGGSWWLTEFARVGFRLNRTIATPPWACCAFVLQRDS